ncbi:hypothetical protein NE237_028573 [Protea cynaroides]|uniref:Uncharacterized protein n=1 Tax=Protea cynaroides TaxID=273540 RepID=A0A9Q0GPM0_9MAGN|nr:hypothetical protein NE237_028573 [Protea cynaroides]
MLLLHLYGKEALSVISRPFYADKMTTMKERLAFALVYMEFIDDSPMKDFIVIADDEGNWHTQAVWYDWRLDHCSICKIFGHATIDCVKNSDAQLEKAVGEKQAESSVGHGSADFLNCNAILTEASRRESLRSNLTFTILANEVNRKAPKAKSVCTILSSFHCCANQLDAPRQFAPCLTRWR